MFPMLLAAVHPAVRSQSWFRSLEIGIIVAGLGAFALLVTGFLLNGNTETARSQRAVAMITGAVLLGIGFVLQVLGLHFAF